MKEIFNYTVSAALLILTVLCVISPVEVFAEGNSRHQVSYTWENSVYSDIFEGYESSEYDLEIKDSIKSASDNNYFTTAKSAGENLRKGLVDRKKTIVLKYKMPTAKLSNKNWFSILCNDILKYTFMHTGVPEEGDSVRHVVKSYTSKAEYLKYSENTYITITFNFTYYTTAAQESALDAQISSLKKKLALDGKSEYETVKGIYDYICNHVEYDDRKGDAKYTAYGALLNEKAACLGYAVLFYRLALEHDIDARVITGKGKSQQHAWNIVRIDGKYYNVDSTWDAGCSRYSYFLKGSKYFSNHTRNREYMSESFTNRYPTMTSNYICTTHKWKSEYTIDKKPTYAAAGSKSIHCSVCNCKKTDSITVIPKLVCKLPAPKTVKTELTAKHGILGGYDDIKVTWQKANGASGYYIKYRKNGTKSWKSVTTTNLYLIMKDMTDGARYEIVVIPYINEKGIKYKSTNSKSVTSVYTLKKTNITGKLKNQMNKVTIKWSGIEGETGYQLFRATSKDGKYVKVATVNVTDKKTVSVKVNAKKGTVYWYKVRAYKKINQNCFVYSPWSDKVKCIR